MIMFKTHSEFVGHLNDIIIISVRRKITHMFFRHTFYTPIMGKRQEMKKIAHQKKL